jgi:hypothetical protein
VLVRAGGAAIIAAVVVAGVAGAWNLSRTNPGNALTAATLGTPGSPASARVPAAGNSCTSFNLTWTAAANADRYRIERRIAGTWTTVAASHTSTNYTDTVAATHYTVDHRITPLRQGTSWEGPPVQASATCGVGDVEDLLATLQPNCLSTVLTWTIPAGANSVVVRRSVNGGAWNTAVATVNAPTATWTDTTQHPAHATVEYLVEARLGGTIGNVSNLVSITDYGCLVPPTNVAVTESCTSTQLTWTAAPGATEYTVRRRLNGGAWASAATNVAGTSWTDNTAHTRGTLVEYGLFSENGTLVDTVLSSTASLYYGWYIRSIQFVNTGTLGTLDVGDQVIITFSRPVAAGDVTKTQIRTSASGGATRGAWFASAGTTAGNTDIARLRSSANNHFSTGTANGTAAFDGARRIWTWTSTSAGITHAANLAGNALTVGTSAVRAQCSGNNANLNTTPLPTLSGRW